MTDDPNGTATTDGDLPSVLRAYHAMMDQFLRTQESVVMTAIGASGAPAAPVPVHEAALLTTSPETLVATSPGGQDTLTGARQSVATIDPAAVPAPKGPPAHLPRYVQTPFAESVDHLAETLPKGTRVLVTETEDGLHEPVIQHIAEAGGVPVLLPRRVLDAIESGGFAAWIGAIDQGFAPQALVWLEGRSALPPLDTLEIEEWRAIHRGQGRRLFLMLQVLRPQLIEGGRIVAALSTGGLFGRTLDTARPSMSQGAGVLGLLKALSLEWPGCSSKIVDLDPDESADAQAIHLVRELSILRGRREVGYPAGVRTIFRTESASLSPPRAPVLPGPDWVVVATGGARGITAECLRTIAPYRPTLILIGRSAVPPAEGEATRALDRAGLRGHFLTLARQGGLKPRPAEIEQQIARHIAARDMRQNIEDFQAAGARVEVICGDVSKIDRLIADIYARHGRIDLFLHGAGLIEDALVEHKVPESFDRVFATKVDSAFLIARSLRPEGLKGLCFFTSVAGRYGNRGQGDYAAANETLNRLAWDLARLWGPSVAVKAINWGPWGATTTGAGMVTDTVRAQFEARGIFMVEAEAGRDLFFKEMFWASHAQVESVAWVADGETMEERACGLPPPPDRAPLGAPLVLLANAFRAGPDRLSWRFDLVNAPYVDHHRFDGVGVMPIAAMLQMLMELPRGLGDPRPVVELVNVQLYRGLTLGDGPTDLLFVLGPPGADGLQRANVYSTDNLVRPRYRADLRLGDSLPPGNVAPPPVPAGQVWQGKEIAWVYRFWLSHGPRFQTLDRLVELTDKRVLSLAHGTRPSDFVPVAQETRWDLDPGLVDGLLQTIWTWSREKQNATPLPVSVESVARYDGDPLMGPLTVETRILTGLAEDRCVTDLLVYDAAGRLCYRLKNFVGQSAPRLNRLGGGWQGGEIGAD